MRRLVAAPDKFYGTATSPEAAHAIARGAQRAGWSATLVPMSDGGEGFCAALGGTPYPIEVHGPLGEPVLASFAVRPDGTALVESAQAAGRALLRAPRGDDPVRASTRGVGELVAAALAAPGVRRVVVGCGGTSSTDGGRGCVEALLDARASFDVPVLVACDVAIPFVEAAASFAPQKGATPAQVAALRERLEDDAAYYAARFGVDVRSVPGSGAGGGLAGGLVALGAKAVGGAALVAELLGLDDALGAASLVVTGEGRVDRGTLEGKVVATVLDRAPGLDALIVAGILDDGVVAALAARRAGRTGAAALDHGTDTGKAIAAAVAAHLATLAR